MIFFITSQMHKLEHPFPVMHKAAIRRIPAASSHPPMLRSTLLFALVTMAIAGVWYGMGRPEPIPSTLADINLCHVTLSLT